MSLFEEHISGPVRFGQIRIYKGIPIPLKKLSKITNYIEKGQNIIIAGKSTSGKASFMDYIYFINVFKWWHDLPSEVRPQIKMFYFSMKLSTRMKLQKWLCLYLKLEYNMVIDIPTLNNGVGKLYELDAEDKEKISSAYTFFTDLENGPLTLVSGKQTPTNIFNRVSDYMKTIGRLDEHGSFSLDQKHEDQHTFVYVDNVDYSQTETDNFSMLPPDMLKRKFGEYIEAFRDVYKITSVIIAPSRPSFTRIARETEPTYKELGLLNDVANIGIVLYNPFNENNTKYGGYPINDMVIRGKNRFRGVSVVRNIQGLENVSVGSFFIGECGFFAESPHPNEPDMFEEKIEMLRSLP